jgi:hypothetical protein
MPTKTEEVSTAAGASRSYRLEILLVSFASLLLEVSYTRVTSFKLYYYYTYLVIGLALLGIGFGGVIMSISTRLRRASTEAILMWSSLLGAASVGVGYVVIARTPINTLAIWDYGSSDSFSSLLRLLLICFVLFASFVAIGIIVATLFARRSDQIGRLYAADLVGAGLACAIVVSLFGWIGPPSTIMLAGLVLGVPGLRIATRRHSRALPLGVLVTLALLVGAVVPSALPDQRPDDYKAFPGDATSIYSSWSALFRVDVFQANPDVRILEHDGLIGSAIYKWDGKVSSLSRFDTDPRRFPFAAVGDPPKNELIIGAAGGHEILTSLYFDARHVDAVELNPVTYKLVTENYADYDGHIAENPHVNYVKGEGRSYLERSDKTYDLIWYPAPDSYSAVNAATAGAFVLSESYLYTKQTITDSFDHLGRNGVLAVQYGEFEYDTKPNRTLRYIATARDALADRGVHDPSKHIIVATTPAPGVGGTLSTILVKKTPFTQAETNRVLDAIHDIPGSQLRYASGEHVADSPVSELASIKESQVSSWLDNYPYDVSAITDNGPFFWHFVPFGKVLSEFTEPINRADPEAGIGERVLILLLAVAVLFAAVFLLLPFFAIRKTWRALPKKGRSAIYFAALGFGFIFFEVTLIQRLVLYLGYPTYSLTVTLMSLLLFSGLGAYLSSRYEHLRDRVIPVLFGALAILTAFYLFGLEPLTDATIGASLAIRVVIAFLVIAPLGLCLGTFMPIGIGAVAGLTESRREYVAWGWAVNGFASVAGAVLSTILAMTFGFNLVLVLALAIYGVALLALRSLLRTGSGTPAQIGSA